MKNAIVVIEKETAGITTQAMEIAISNQGQYERANTFLRAVKTLQKRIHETFDPIVEAAHRTHKEATTKRKEHLDPALRAEQVVKSKMISYTDEMEKKRREEQERLIMQARRDEEKKRKELAARAEKWAAKGNEAKAEELQEQAEDVHVEAPVVAPKVEKTAGVSYREQWSVEITDESQVPREYLTVNIQMLNRIAQAEKGIRKIPGVKFVCKKIMSSRFA